MDDTTKVRSGSIAKREGQSGFFGDRWSAKSLRASHPPRVVILEKVPIFIKLKPVNLWLYRSPEEASMPKLYLRATGPNTFEWVKSLKKATADYRKPAMVTLKQLRSAKLIEVPDLHLMNSKWVISRNK